jgi:hypothetical protein
LANAGLFIGDELLGANRSNPYGHFEDIEVFDLHNAILADNGMDWQVDVSFIPHISKRRWRKLQNFVEKRQTNHAVWGFKDPRVCLFLQVWKYLIPDLKVVGLYRDFADVTYSLRRRHSENIFLNLPSRRVDSLFWDKPDVALRMWLVHNKGILRFMDAYPEDSLLISHADLVKGYPIIRVLNREWGLRLKDVSVFDVYDSKLFEKPIKVQPLYDETLADEVLSVWEDLETASQTLRF